MSTERPLTTTRRQRTEQRRRATLQALSLTSPQLAHAHRLLEDIEDADDQTALDIAEARADGFILGLRISHQVYAWEVEQLRRLYLSAGSGRRLLDF